MLKLVRFYAPRGLKLVRGEGQYVWDSEGRRYLDCHTAHGVGFLGHRNPYVVRSIMEQLEKIMIASPTFDTEIMEESTRLLEKILPKDHTYFYMLNGGAEGVELALKAARRVTGRKKFISFINAFHGRSMGALAVTWNPRYRAGYDPFPWEVDFLPYNRVDVLEKRVDENVAAIIVEPVQGEGGLAVASNEFLKSIRDLCDKVGALMIVDEVQSGFGRTGILWAHVRAGIRPDIMVAGKCIGGGFPLSIVSFSEEVGSKLGVGAHGSTFGGNPLALAAMKGGIEALMRDDVIGKADEIGEAVKKMLEGIVEEYPKFTRKVRGLGLMIGLELRFNPAKALRILQSRRVLALRAGLNVLRFLPPYLINRDDIRFLEEALHETLQMIASET
ncbi:MAG: aspartate aminotransferase family protein [Candidatus Wolframiiraptor sp. EX4484-121]|nr:MAG: aspartate aminotransferase family protein [Candidatus Wolframiiraptor sp. EX4484-121]